MVIADFWSKESLSNNNWLTPRAAIPETSVETTSTRHDDDQSRWLIHFEAKKSKIERLNKDWQISTYLLSAIFTIH